MLLFILLRLDAARMEQLN